MNHIMIDSHTIIDNGQKSYFYKVSSKDVGHFYYEDRVRFFQDVQNSLNQLRDRESPNTKVNPRNTNNHFYKMYSLRGETFLATDDTAPEIHGMEFFEERGPIEVLFGTDNFYSNISFDKDHFVLNGEFIRFINLYSMPESLGHNELCQLGDYFLVFRKYPKAHGEMVVDRLRKVYSSNSNAAKYVSDVKSELKQSDTEEMYLSLVQGESLFDVAFWFIVRSNTKENLECETQDILKSLKRLRCVPLIETVANQTILRTFIPSVFTDFRRSHLCGANYLGCMLPFMDEKIHESGVTFYSEFGNPVQINIFDKENLNFNAVFTGVSGSGKSALNQKFVYEQLQQGASAVLIDWGYSYKKITQYFDGNIFTEKFNPMQFKDVKYLQSFVLSAVPAGEIRFRDTGLIYEIIEGFLCSEPHPTFKKLIYKISGSIEGFEYFFSDFWEYITDEDIQIKNITYVDTRLYPERVRASLILYLTQYYDQIKTKKVFGLDESWRDLIVNSFFVEALARTVRKNDGSFQAITQSIMDFDKENSKVGATIFNLSQHRFHFKDDNIPESFNSEDAEIIKNLKSVKGSYSEFLYRNGSVRKVLRYPMTPLEYELFSTTHSDVVAFEKFFERYKNFFGFKEIMHKWVDFKYGFGEGYEN